MIFPNVFFLHAMHENIYIQRNRCNRCAMWNVCNLEQSFKSQQALVVYSNALAFGKWLWNIKFIIISMVHHFQRRTSLHCCWHFTIVRYKRKICKFSQIRTIYNICWSIFKYSTQHHIRSKWSRQLCLQKYLPLRWTLDAVRRNIRLKNQYQVETFVNGYM